MKVGPADGETGLPPCQFQGAGRDWAATVGADEPGVRLGADEACQVLHGGREDVGWHRHGAPAGYGLRHPDDGPSPWWQHHGPLHSQCAMEQVDVASLEPEHLAPPKLAPCG